ncbi:hypothetical protein HY768_10655 [candidate division TA06 bacterium]|uniref:Glycosyl hydrolase-like 10 domain-containing protein n=1 Tax=candidate division TA06 bacterium TaxID=2250710 RepID=A0A933IAL8_UNCT6|nr:hypothetical protein [candidate division TA06 bacterium]
MHKYLSMASLLAISLLALNLGTVSSPYQSPYFSVNKAEYFRYEMVFLNYKPDYSQNINPDSSAVSVKFFFADTAITSPGDCREITLRYDQNQRSWRGTWPLPWNPPLGGYKAVLSVSTKQSKVDSTTLLQTYANTEKNSDSTTLLPSYVTTLLLSDSTTFLVKSRTPKSIPAGFCVMTIESSRDVSRTALRSPYNATRKWQNFGDWAKFLGADAVWFSLGWTIEGHPGINDQNPWVKDNFKALPRLAEEAHKQGLQFGGYVGSYLLWGPPLKKLKYEYSIETSQDAVFRNHHVNLDDAKRRDDIVKALKILEQEPNVDFIGLDYIRPGAGGYETVNQFVELMNIQTPKGWNKWPPNQRILWVARQVRLRDLNPVHARWQWWQAHRTALAVVKLMEGSGVTKPVWGFTLGWDKGHEHGQDPCMMNDAGLDIDAVMMYESTAKYCWQMTSDWSNYLKGDEAQLLVGQEVDWPLLQNSVNPPAPEEMYWRWTDAIKGYTDGGRIKGMFWHDMFRDLRGRKGPYSSREWLIAGAAGFSKLRQELGLHPLTARLMTSDNSLSLSLKLLSPVNNLNIEALTPNSPLRQKNFDLASSLPDTVIRLGNIPKSGLAAYRLTWGSSDRRNQIVVFSYFPQTYLNQPFRQWQAFRSGGDILFAHQSESKSYKLALKAGQLARAKGLAVNHTSIDSLFPNLAYKYSRIIITLTDSLTGSQQQALQKWFATTGNVQNTSLINSGLSKTLPSPAGLTEWETGSLASLGFARFLQATPSTPIKPGLKSFIRLAIQQ